VSKNYDNMNNDANSVHYPCIIGREKKKGIKGLTDPLIRISGITPLRMPDDLRICHVP
jgi:hypothetical protein